jgi:uncharacterized iron-regulated membrane protein
VSGREHSTARMDAKALARARRDALHARTRRIRHAVAGMAVTLFVLVFAVVYVQLASGHDPALVANARKHAIAGHRTSSATADGSATATEATDSTESSGTTGSAGGSESTATPESSASAVTTSQS